MRILIVTAANEGFAPLLKGLVESLHQWGPLKHGDLGVLDLDLSPETLKWLGRFTDRIVKPSWDLNVSSGLAREKPWLRAMTSRPFLPRHFPGYDMYLWLDADTWVQQPFALDWLVQAAGTGKLAIVPTVDRSYRHRPAAVLWRLERLRRYFGNIPTEMLLTETYVNSGVFALASDAPHWDLWARHFREGLESCHGEWVTDQTALNFAVWTEQLPVYPLPSRCNWTCHLSMPEYRVATGLFHEPTIPGDPIGIIHLTANTKDKSVEARGPDGQIFQLGLQFGAARLRAGSAESNDRPRLP